MQKLEKRTEQASAQALLGRMSRGEELSGGQQLRLVLQLSVPAIMAQITSIIMQYIDASMVGYLGAGESASIGLVSSSTWLFGGVCSAVAVGFSVQVAQLIGANRQSDARRVVKQSLIAALIVSLVLSLFGLAISRSLPGWLGAEEAIRENAVEYFRIYMLFAVALEMNYLAGSMLRCSGNMKIPSVLNVIMCVLDVAFNALLIFPSREIALFSGTLWIPGAGLGVAGAALGTALAETVTAVFMCSYLFFHSPSLKFRREDSWRLERSCVEKAVRIAVPVAMEHALMCGAMVVTTRIVAPLGTVSIAANSFAVTAESLCYMPGYGIADAATTLVGQSIGAGRTDLVKRLSRMAVWLGIAIMTVTGAFMFVAAPAMMAILTPNPDIRALGVTILRIEAFAEPLYGASIVVSGALRGAGDTLIPSLMNFGSIWFVRLSLALILTRPFGLVGVWIAMCTELCFRGLIFLHRLYRGKWMRRTAV